MTRSTYEQPLPADTPNVATAHDAKGQPTALPRGWESMPETAASGLWTTPTEFSQLLIALMEAWRGGKPALLSRATVEEMMTEVGPSVFGLGPALAHNQLRPREIELAVAGGNERRRGRLLGGGRSAEGEGQG